METPEKAKTGPKTPEGKRISSLNALKHGLTAVSPQAHEKMAAEFEANFAKVHIRMLDYYKPQDNLEQELVKRIAECLFKLNRCRGSELYLHTRNPDASRPNTSLQTLQKYERGVDVQLHRAINTMARKRELERKKIEQGRRAVSLQSPGRPTNRGI